MILLHTKLYKRILTRTLKLIFGSVPLQLKAKTTRDTCLDSNFDVYESILDLTFVYPVFSNCIVVW
jgi:hypothetical protein